MESLLQQKVQAESQVSEQLKSLTETSLKDWLLEKGIPLEVADGFYGKELRM